MRITGSGERGASEEELLILKGRRTVNVSTLWEVSKLYTFDLCSLL